MSETDYSRKALDLTCPHCRGALSVIMEHNPNPMEREYYPDGLECGNCDSTWDLKGNQTQDPNWVRFPESFRKPE